MEYTARNLMLCSACGKPIDDRSPFCSSCGAPAAIADPRSKTNPIVIIVVAVVAVFGILVLGGIALALVTPNLGKARMSAEEMSAIQNVRTICAAQMQYYLLYNRYATSLSELGPSSDGKTGPSFADLLPADLAAGAKGGYTYTVKASPTGFTVNANPVKYGTTGRRTFFSDESMVIRANSGPGPASAASKELNQR